MYKKTVLSNGLRIVTHDIKQRESVSIGFWISVGGRYEENRFRGAAHFLEHIVFKGSQKYSCEQIKMLIEGVGGAMNAFTSEEQTCFYAKIPAKHLTQTFDVLADMVCFPKIMAKDVAKEKTVIIEEIKMYRDLPQYLVMEILDNLVWPDHPLGKSLTGTEQSVSALTSRDLKTFHETYYTPGNIVVAACGRLDHEKIVNLTRRKLGKISRQGRTDYLKDEECQVKARACFFKKDIEQTHVLLGIPGFSEDHNDRYVLSLLSLILGGNMSSRLFVELREKRGLAYSISSSSKSLHDTGLFTIRAGVDNAKVIKTMQLVLKELTKIKRYGVTQSEFVRGKDYILGQVLMGLEDTMEHMLWLGEPTIAKNKFKTLKEVVKEFESIKKSDIKRVAKEIFDGNKFNLAVVGPLSDKQKTQLNQLMRIKEEL